MTYERLLVLVKIYLIGDKTFPKEWDISMALLEDAFVEVADRAASLHLMTLSTEANALRLSTGDYLLRFPDLPEDFEDELDIDMELCAPVARFMAASVSAEKGPLHIARAEQRILKYNAKVYDILDTQAQAELEEAMYGGIGFWADK